MFTSIGSFADVAVPYGEGSGKANFINNKNLQNSIIDYLKTHDYGNESEVEKIYQLIKKNLNFI